jgi:hypothetical protein
MNKLLTCFFSFLFLGFKCLGQKDSLYLIIRSKYKQEDSAKSFAIQIDFVSMRHKPVTFIYNPLFSLNCCNQPEDELGVNIEKLEGNCYQHFSNCADCDPVSGHFPESEKKQLHFGETISYKDSITLFNRYGSKGKVVGFTGNYRCRAWRIYSDQDGKHKIYSNWLYVNFEDYKSAPNNSVLPKQGISTTFKP